MKTLLSTILFSLMSTFLFCQNWNILNPEVTYYYSHSDSIHLTNTINIDSVIVDGENEISYISNKYLVCDTCDFNPDYEVIIHRYAEEFLGFDVSKQIEGNYYMINEDTLFHQSNTGASWNFNTELTATTSSIIEDEFLGEIDSLKTIILSSSDTIILSINHGIIRYPDFENEGKYYELKGYHDNEWYYGEVFPNFWSIYDFAVGDEYCGYYGSAYLFFDSFTKQIKVISVLSIDETGIVYETSERGTHVFGSDASWTPWSETTYFNNENSTQSFFRFSGQFEDYFGISKNINFSQESIDYFEPYYQNQLTYVDYNPDNFIVSKNDFIPAYGYVKIVSDFSNFGDSLLYRIIDEDNYFELKYVNQMGRMSSLDFVGLDGMSSEGLNGAVISGDTIGDFCNFPIDLGVENIEINPLSIHPNPASSQITIKGKFESLEILSQTGQLVLKIEEQINVIDVSNLSPGIYFIKATNEEKLYTTKLIIE